MNRDTQESELKDDRRAALHIYQGLTTRAQKKHFMEGFFDPEKGAGGKNMKSVVQMKQYLEATNTTEVAATESWLSRPYIHISHLPKFRFLRLQSFEI